MTVAVTKITEESVDENTVEDQDLMTKIAAFLRQKASKGANMTDVVKHVALDREVVKEALHKGVSQKLLRKNSNRYYIIEGKL